MDKQTMNAVKNTSNSSKVLENWELAGEANPLLMSDCYKFMHRELYPDDTEIVYSNLTPRQNSYYDRTDKMVVFGYQLYVMEYLVDFFTENFFYKPASQVIAEYKQTVGGALGELSDKHLKSIADLHKLGYLPIEIKALPEGTLVPMKVPVLTITNTLTEYAWLVGFLETTLLNQTYTMANTATKALEFRKIGEKYASLSAESNAHVDWQFHDFSLRGQHGWEAGAKSGLAHLTSFKGSDTMPASWLAQKYYGADADVMGSVVATEHSVMQSYGEDEVSAFSKLIETRSKLPAGNNVLSVVSDTYDYFNVLTNVLPQVKEQLLKTQVKLVVRPDSGKPMDILLGKDTGVFDISWYFDNYTDEEQDITHAYIVETLLDLAKGSFRDDEELSGEHGERGVEYHIFKYAYKETVYAVKVEPEYNRYDKQFYYIDGMSACLVYTEPLVKTPEQKGTLEILWETFGGTVNSKGFKVLHPQVGVLFGEGITEEVAEEILSTMTKQGWSSENVVFGVGAYVYSVTNTRDTFGQAIKTTEVTIDGKAIPVFKDPKTDVGGLKKSAKGQLMVVRGADGELALVDNLTALTKRIAERSMPDQLRTIYKDGFVYNAETLETVRERLLAEIAPKETKAKQSKGCEI